jgi:hypothetical protein
LAVLLLSRLEDSQHISTKKGQTINDFISLMMNEGISNYIFKQLHERVEVDKYIKGTIPNTTFAPRVIDKECIHDVMSDTAFNWVNFTKYWEERSIRDIIKCFGISEDEKHNVIDILRQSSHGFYSAGCNDRPEQVDAMLDDLDEEIRLQFNPGADKTLTGEVSLVQQPESNDEEENLSTNQKEKDRLISELREENKSLTNEVNRLKLENDELHQNQSEGGEEEWIECFDGFLHSSLNPQAIAKALEGITHSYFPKHQRGYWWVFVTVLTEIGWIPQTNYKLVLQWANLHFKCGWDWKKDNQFKFSDINDKIRSVQPSSKWNKSVTGSVIGDYYGELAKTMKETFVVVVDGNKLLDKKEFILPGCLFINNGRK